MRWKLILEEFGTNIQHTYEVDNIVYDILSRLAYISVEKYKPITRKNQCCAEELFEIGRVENNKCFSNISLEC